MHIIHGIIAMDLWQVCQCPAQEELYVPDVYVNMS